MKILYHHRTQGRGVERVHIMGIVNALRESGHKVDILSVPGADLKEIEDKNVSIVRKKSILGFVSSKLHGSIFEMIEIAYNFLILIRIPNVLRKSRYDFVYERYSLFMFATVFICKIIRKPIILEINDSVLVPRVRKCYLKPIAKLFEKWTFKNATGLVIISTVFKDIIVDNYGELRNYVISPNAVNLKDLPDVSVADVDALKLELGIAEGDVICGYTGAFHEWHGVRWFVDLLLSKLEKESRLKVLMVGDGPLFAEIEDKISKKQMSSNIILTGRVPHSEINLYLSVMDYAVMPDSNTYGSPMKIFEYMAKKLAVIAPAYGPIAETVIDGKTGWLTPVSEHEQLVDMLISASNDKDELNSVGNNAFQYILNERQWKNNASQIFEMLNTGKNSKC